MAPKIYTMTDTRPKSSILFEYHNDNSCSMELDTT